MPGIKGVLETSFLDWPGRSCAVLFFGGCNLRCPFCHNHPLVLEPESIESQGFDDVCRRLGRFKKWLGGLCISGGEPTLNPELPEMLRELKGQGWKLKLDTNGTRPEVLERLLADRLLDMVAMDVKTVLVKEKYQRCAGTKVDLDRIRASISTLQCSGIGHEFRMTIMPLLHSEEDVINWAVQLQNGSGSRLKLQNFNPRSTLDPEMSRQPAFGQDVFERLCELVASRPFVRKPARRPLSSVSPGVAAQGGVCR